MKIFIDIDNTIFKTDGNNYKCSTPIQENIDKANKLYDDGHIITYWTARGCKSGKSSEYFSLTYEQLNQFNVKFHELRMGKPHFDLFIDDKGLNAMNSWTDDNINSILEFQKNNDALRVADASVSTSEPPQVDNNTEEPVNENDKDLENEKLPPIITSSPKITPRD